MSLKKKDVNEFIQDEKMGNKEYLKAAKKAKGSRWKKMFRRMAKDERRHRKMLKNMKREM